MHPKLLNPELNPTDPKPQPSNHVPSWEGAADDPQHTTRLNHR